MLMTEDQVKNGDYDYWKAREYIKKMDEALKADHMDVSDLPGDVQAEYKRNKEIINDNSL